LPAGRVRKGLEADVVAARAAEFEVTGAGIATLRTLADQIDHHERGLRADEARAYDRLVLAHLVQQFDTTYDRVFAALRRTVDPWDLLAGITEPTADDPAGPQLPQ
jgi:hypothetical protein